MVFLVERMDVHWGPIGEQDTSYMVISQSDWSSACHCCGRDMQWYLSLRVPRLWRFGDRS
jgi:hypothetical protein